MAKKKKAYSSEAKININIHKSGLEQGVIVGSTNPIQYNYKEASHFRHDFVSALSRLEFEFVGLQNQLSREQAQDVTRELQVLKSEVSGPAIETKQDSILAHLNKIKDAMAGFSSVGFILKQLYDLVTSFFLE